MVQPVELALAGAKPLLGVVEVATDEARVQVLDHVAQPALGEEQRLVCVFATRQLLRDSSHDRAAEDRQALHDRLERDAFLRVPAGGHPGQVVVVLPGHARVGAEGAEQDLQEAHRGPHQVVDRPAFSLHPEQLRLERPDRFRHHLAAVPGVGGEPVRELAEKVASSLGHVGAL